MFFKLATYYSAHMRGRELKRERDESRKKTRTVSHLSIEYDTLVYYYFRPPRKTLIIYLEVI